MGPARRVRSGSPKGLPVSLQLPPRQRADRVSCTGRRSIAQPYKSRYVPTAPSPAVAAEADVDAPDVLAAASSSAAISEAAMVCCNDSSSSS